MILIKDMKMPDSCVECPMIDGEYGWCKRDRNISMDFDERPSNCPLIETVEVQDAVSRAAAIDAIKQVFEWEVIMENDYAIKSRIFEHLRNLPSAQPETEERTAESSQKVPKEDLISRKTAIEALFDWETNYDWDDRCRKESPKPEYIVSPSDVIEKLPSAQPYTEDEIQKMQDLEQAQLNKMYQLGYEDGLAERSWFPCKDCEKRCDKWGNSKTLAE